jgi:uncharacterized protein YuzE
MLRPSYDPDTDALFVRFAADGVVSVRTEEVAPGVMLDLDAAGNAISLEVLDVRAGSAEVETTAATVE